MMRANVRIEYRPVYVRVYEDGSTKRYLRRGNVERELLRCDEKPIYDRDISYIQEGYVIAQGRLFE